jgi:hypothetical protein
MVLEALSAIMDSVRTDEVLRSENFFLPFMGILQAI